MAYRANGQPTGQKLTKIVPTLRINFGHRLRNTVWLALCTVQKIGRSGIDHQLLSRMTFCRLNFKFSLVIEVRVVVMQNERRPIYYSC